MKNTIKIFLFLFVSYSWAQVDYSNNWEDFYSYNNVKDFVKVGDVVYAITDNAVFKYNQINNEVTKLSSVNGLSGEVTSSIHYSSNFKSIFIGYNTGLLEVVDEENNIHIAKDIVSFNYSGNKSINSITEYNNKLYLATPFAIVVYDGESLQFGDTYFIGNQSTEVFINDIAVYNDVIYAATENGIYSANVSNPNLIDFNNWEHYSSGNFTSVELFKNIVYTSKNKNLYKFENGSLTVIKSESSDIVDLKSSIDFLAISKLRNITVINSSHVEIYNYTSSSTSEYYFNLNTALLENDVIFLGTKEFGILKAELADGTNFHEIHPEGPSSNELFNIEVKDNNLWVLYGAFDPFYGPKNVKKGIDHFNNSNWQHIPYKDFGVKNLVSLTFDYSNSNKVYISSWGASTPSDILNTGGVLVVENDEISDFWNYTNSGLEKIFLPQYPNYHTTRINGSAFDNNGNLWITNGGVSNALKKYDTQGNWSGIDMSTVYVSNSGLSEVDVDKTNSIWIGTHKDGVLVYNEEGNRTAALVVEDTKGALPDLNVRSIKVDASNRVWIGTVKGLVVYYNASNVFNETILNAEPVIILDNDLPQRLLGEQRINSIGIDGADNKWFGTSTSGVMQTNPNGSNILQQFNKNNSPLPSNKILKVSVDKSTGKVYFGTDNGIVAYNSNVSTYSDSMPEVYAYPNPSTKTNDFITIDGRNGSHLPKGTNVKIVDAAGNLVYETNIKEGQELFGGKVVWNKTNLAGRKVASGVYIVLLSANEASETAVAKIAIIN
ncbi:hypothetical protein SAMN05444411_1016 [Lutibacter oricola]|uniref:PorZ N-terminal beta-propeller domain-containing protein n=1 Tax=Lutibacter oricola TaxID=762486 RepID=A0A1H2QHB1_9FLAO|nr:hypothetical protein [Lutibacter oricola]SDW06593.1 hypothetical protein SAMN05444411_1016 [Lutibacter oricola]